VGGQTEGGQFEFYALPTTWIRPDHTGGPFSRFQIVNPRDPSSSGSSEWFGRENIAFAHLPNPSDPLSALAPATSQMMAIRVDDHIQTSQERFFENGIFPSVVVTIGRDPHPDVASGVRPRLSGGQRRQVIGAIKKAMGGVANYGNPGIVDGLIERIDRLSATQNEMGWDKSEDKVMKRILSAFCVHPYILGDAVSIGGYAQAAKIEERFCKRVNTFLDMLGTVMGNFAAPMAEGKDKLMVWWEKCEPHDPSLRWTNIREGRKNNDITRNEFRYMLGLPPAEVEEAKRSKLLESVGGMTGAVQILNVMGQGGITPETAAKLFALFFEITVEEATEIIGEVEGKEEDAIEEATDALELAIEAIGVSPKNMAAMITRSAK
jgi:hypothetical protein